MVNILVIDDDRQLLSQIRMFLEDKEFQTFTAHTGTEGLDLARKHIPDLIICDVMMPDMDGYAVFEALQESPETNTIPFLFLSGLSHTSDVRKAMGLGADDYLTKPVELHELENAIMARLQRQKVLEQKYDSTVQKLRKSITYALPHELRTPLLGVIGYGEMLKEDHAKLTPAEIAVYAEGIVKAGYRLHRLIENYLVYAQLEIIASDPEQVKSIRNSYSLNTLMTVIEHHSRVRADAHERGSDLRLDLINGTLRMSENNLGKIVSELIDNAMKFSEKGTIVTIRTEIKNNIFILEITDRGRGMTTEQLENIGAYMQFERTLHEQQGLGLGLAIVGRLVDLHQGKMRVQSQLDKGTRVTINLPVE